MTIKAASIFRVTIAHTKSRRCRNHSNIFFFYSIMGSESHSTTTELEASEYTSEEEESIRNSLLSIRWPKSNKYSNLMKFKDQNISMHMQGNTHMPPMLTSILEASSRCSDPSARPPAHPSADSYTAETIRINHQTKLQHRPWNHIKNTWNLFDWRLKFDSAESFRLKLMYIFDQIRFVSL